MGKYLGDIHSGCRVADSFTTVTTTGAPTVLTGTAGSVCLVAYRFQPGEATGFTCSTAGITLATNCAGATGWNTYEVNLGSSTTFYACGHDYALILQGGTVGGTCVSGYEIASFSIHNRSPLRPTDNGKTLRVTTGGAANINWAGVENCTNATTLSCTTAYSVVKLVDRPFVDICSTIYSVQKLIDTSNIGTGAAPSANSIACTIWDELKYNNHSTCGSFGYLLDKAISSIAGASLTVGAIACTVWDELKYNNHSTCGSFGYLLDCQVSKQLQPEIDGRRLAVTASGNVGVNWARVEACTTAQNLTCTLIYSANRIVDVSNISTTFSGPSANSVACTVWNSLRSDYGTCGTFGYLLDCRTSAALQPEIPLRRAAITSGGEIGINWGRIAACTTVVSFDCTTTYDMIRASTLADLACASIFSVHSVDNVVQTVAGSLTVGAIACTVWDTLQSTADVCGSYGYMLNCQTGAALQPEIPLRRAAITSGGEIGVNWARVASCTTLQNLTCTNIFSVHSVDNITTSLSSVSANSIACTVWDELQTNAHSTCGSFGYLLNCQVSAALQPEIPNRRLAVTAAGNTGINWGRVEACTTAQTLTCTSLFSVTRVNKDEEGLTEPGAVFTWGTSTQRDVMAWLGALGSNCITQTATVQTICTRAVSGTIASALISCSSTIVSRGTFGTVIP